MPATTFQSVMSCRHCSSRLTGSEKFCPTCGTDLYANSQIVFENVAQTELPAPQESKRANRSFADKVLDTLDGVHDKIFNNGNSGPENQIPTPREDVSNILKSDVKNEFVLSNLIIAGIGLLSTFLPYTDAYIRGSKIGLGLGVDGGFSAGGKIFLLISILFAGIGAIHFTDWIRDNENVTASTSGIFAVFLGVLGFIVLSAQSSSITSSMDNLGESAGLGVGVYFGYLDAVAMIGFGAVCFLNPRFFKDSSSK
jgi:hypothetical protein